MWHLPRHPLCAAAFPLAAACLVLSIGGCGEKASTEAPATGHAQATITASGANAGEHYDVAMSYLRQPTVSIPFVSQSFTATGSAAQTLLMPIDLSTCLRDAQHVAPQAGACSIVVSVALRGVSAGTLDSVSLTPVVVRDLTTASLVAPLHAADVITLTAPVNVFVGDTVRVQAAVKDRTGALVTGRTLTWTSSNNSIATVNTTGLITAVTGGNVSITATTPGATASVAIAALPHVATIEIKPDTLFLTPPRDGTMEIAGSGSGLYGRGMGSYTIVMKDAAGNQISDRTGAVTISDNALATTVAGSTGVQITSKGVVGLGTVSVAIEGKTATATLSIARPFAVIDANQPTVASYVVGRNNFGFDMTVTRTAVGRYTLVHGIGGLERGMTTAFLLNATSAFANAALAAPTAVCMLVASVSDGWQVRCQDPVTKADKDAAFRAIVTTPYALSGAQAWTTHTSNSLDSPDPYWRAITSNWYTNIPGNNQRITANVDPGTWNSALTRHEQISVLTTQSAFVSAISTGSVPTQCEPRNQAVGSSLVDVLCFDPTGAVKSAHQLVRVSGARAGRIGGLAMINASSGVNINQGFSSGGAVTTSRIGVGKYTVVFNGMNSTGPLGIVASGWGSSEFVSCSHALVSSTPVTVDVACFDKNGVFSQATTYVQVLVLQ